MTDTIVNAAKPELIAAIDAVIAFNSNIGPDPALWAIKVPGAMTILLGTLSLQVPALAVAEAGALQSDVNAKLTALKAKLQS